jgi:hypothetical protein
MNEQEIHNSLYPKFVSCIIFMLTFQEVFNEGEHPLTLNQSHDFISQNHEKIQNAINEMIEFYDVENYLESLSNIEDVDIILYISEHANELSENIKNARFQID